MQRSAIDNFITFVMARESIRVKRERGDPAPWTKDPILGQYRFCNIRREDDKVTRWIRENWSAQWGHHRDLFFVMAVARLFNRIDTLKLCMPLRPKTGIFDPVMFRQGLEHVREKHGQVFGAAYIISTNGKSGDKMDYVVNDVLIPMWRDKQRFRPLEGDTLAEAHEKLTHAYGMGSFMAAQVIADVKYTKGSALSKASDFRTWCAPGPGSLRGLNRMHGDGPVKTGIKDDYFRQCVNDLQKLVNRKLSSDRPLCAQDVQNCLCEFDKYERARLGEGRPKQIYTPHEDGDMFE